MYITLLIRRILTKSRIYTPFSRAGKRKGGSSGGERRLEVSSVSLPLQPPPFSLLPPGEYLGNRSWPQLTRKNHSHSLVKSKDLGKWVHKRLLIAWDQCLKLVFPCVFFICKKQIFAVPGFT